jgi:hypothetical protein
LFSSTLPADVLYDENSLPRADDELAPASTPSSGKLRQPAQVDDNLRRAQPLALVAKRPMAMSAYGDRHAWVKDASGTGGEDLPFVQDVWGGPVPRAALKHPFILAFKAAVEVKAREAEGRYSRVQLRVKTGRQVQLGGEASYGTPNGTEQ